MSIRRRAGMNTERSAIKVRSLCQFKLIHHGSRAGKARRDDNLMKAIVRLYSRRHRIEKVQQGQV